MRDESMFNHNDKRLSAEPEARGMRGEAAHAELRAAQLWSVAAAASPPHLSEQDARAFNMTVRQFTREEISKWNTRAQTVFIIDNVVYDVTKFLDEHPGGHEVLINVAGKDASEDFSDVGHSLDAKELMQKYVVGELVEADRVEVQRRTMTWEETKTDNETSFLSSWKFPVLLGALVTALYSYLFG